MLAPTNALVAQPQQLHDVTIVRKTKFQRARALNVPSEEFGIGKNDKNIADAGYCFHAVRRREGDLIAEGYDKEQIKGLPSYSKPKNTEQTSRDTVNETHEGGESDKLNNANREIEITEHYIRMDYRGDGKTCLYRVTTGGEECEILKRKGELQIIEEDGPRFAAMTPVIVTHRFFGKSIADLVMDIQRVKTALTRGLLDNTYLALNPWKEIAESHAGENTLDDMLTSRPGNVVRTRQPGGLNVMTHPDISGAIYPALQYMDATREWRTGVSRQGQGVDPNALQNQVATIANQMDEASRKKIILIARIFAETGIRDLFSLLHRIIRKNGSVAQTVKLRNEWVTVDPREWRSRSDMTINVGLGTGGKAQQTTYLNMLIGAQEKAIPAGLVSKANLWNSAKELVKLIGRKDPEAFFTAPPEEEATQAIQPPPDPKMAALQMKGQLDQQAQAHKEKIEVIQAEADVASNNKKIEAEIARAEREAQLEERLAVLEFNLKRELEIMKMQQRREDHAFDMAAAAELHDSEMRRSDEKHLQSLQHANEAAKAKQD